MQKHGLGRDASSALFQTEEIDAGSRSSSALIRSIPSQAVLAGREFTFSKGLDFLTAEVVNCQSGGTFVRYLADEVCAVFEGIGEYLQTRFTGGRIFDLRGSGV